MENYSIQKGTQLSPNAFLMGNFSMPSGEIGIILQVEQLDFLNLPISLSGIVSPKVCKNIYD